MIAGIGLCENLRGPQQLRNAVTTPMQKYNQNQLRHLNPIHPGQK
jgi:hypothetical protein